MSQKITCPCCNAELAIDLEATVTRVTQRSEAKKTPIDPAKRSRIEIEAEARALVADGISLGQAQQMKVDPRVIQAMVDEQMRGQG